MRTPQQAADLFALRPGAQTALLDMGHAYGMAKFSSRCPFTGAEIMRGEAVRRIHLTTRDGKTREGYTANRIFGFMRFTTPVDISWSWNILPGGEWDAHRDAIIDDLDNIQSIVMRKNDYISEEKTYAWDASRGKWCGARWKTYSPKQLAAILRRTRRVCIYRITKREAVKAAA